MLNIQNATIGYPEFGVAVIGGGLLTIQTLPPTKWIKVSKSSPNWSNISKSDPDWTNISQESPDWTKLNNDLS